MEYVYMLVSYGAECEDMIIILSKEEAIAASVKYPKSRVEIFIKDTLGNTPTYNHYIKGAYYGS